MHTRRIKTVKVSDPENFYQQDTVEVALYITPQYKGETKVRVQIITIDDKSWALETEVGAQYRDYINSIYDHYKTWIYDRMPEEISLVWLFEHGFLPV
jgi:hypothetical protein